MVQYLLKERRSLYEKNHLSICGPINGFCSIIRSNSKSRHSSSVGSTNEPVATVEEVVASPTPETATENQGEVAETPTTTDRAAVPAASPTVTSTETASPEVEKLIENMPLKQKVTQMIMPDFRKWQELIRNRHRISPRSMLK